MKNLKIALLLAATTFAAACGDDDGETGNNVECGAGTVLEGNECVSTGDGLTCGPGTMEMLGMCVPTETPGEYVQVEQLARPGIAEALLLSDGFLAGYNATAPTFEGVPPDVLNQVVAEAKTVLRAIYLGTCFINGVVGLTPTTGFKPAGMQCNAVGAALLEGDGETQTAATITASNAYADAVFGLFIPDVMRIDTTVASAYLTPCGGGTTLLCGGRWLRDDVIDITYDFLLNGAATCSTPTNCTTLNQFGALVSDGVSFAPTDNGGGGNNNRLPANPANKQQGHPAVSNAFPYSAAPI